MRFMNNTNFPLLDIRQWFVMCYELKNDTICHPWTNARGKKIDLRHLDTFVSIDNSCADESANFQQNHVFNVYS
ncbi:hypothetical protein HanIR_Chr16g0823221 [Helianthus annuus]|nr:hypothetical protein HanIR_Chr16g0823221 [Helianthus annuus]